MPQPHSRQVEPETGKIVIDGIDITTIGVEDLRSRLVRAFVHPLFRGKSSCGSHGRPSYRR
jgi:ABC-type uncharacterized transport system ATPase component